MNRLSLLFAETIMAASIWQEFKLLFLEMGVATAICLCLGIICLVVEIFNPGFGFFGIAGVILLLVGIVLRIVEGGTLAQLFWLILLTVFVIVIAFAIMSHSAKRGWLSRTPIIMADSAIPTGITEGTADYTSLIGKEGVASSVLRPSGIAIIDGKRFDVVAEGAFIDENTEIIVSSVEGVRIVVKKK